MILDLANLLQVGFDLRNTLERKILSPKIKASDRRQYSSVRKNKVNLADYNFQLDIEVILYTVLKY